MRRFEALARTFALAGTLVTLSGLAACDDDGPTGMGEPPTVLSVTPAPGTTDAQLIQDFRVTFSTAMNPATLNTATVSIAPAGPDLHLAYDEDEHELWIAPVTSLEPQTEYTLSISSAAEAANGQPLEPFSFAFTTGPFDCAHVADRFEPNDDPADPADVPLDTPLPALSTCGDDEDYYRLTITERTKVTARTTIRESGQTSWGVNWWRGEDETIATLGVSVMAGSITTFHHTFEPGTYLLQILGHDDEPLVVYDLLLETGPPCEDDPFEDNDFPVDAPEVEAGTIEGLRGCYLDADWFAVPVLTGQRIRIFIDPGDFAGLRRLRIDEPGGTIAQVSNNTTIGTERVATASGMAHVMVMFWNDDVDYDLAIEVLN